MAPAKRKYPTPHREKADSKHCRSRCLSQHSGARRLSGPVAYYRVSLIDVKVTGDNIWCSHLQIQWPTLQNQSTTSIDADNNGHYCHHTNAVIFSVCPYPNVIFAYSRGHFKEVLLLSEHPAKNKNSVTKTNN